MEKKQSGSKVLLCCISSNGDPSLLDTVNINTLEDLFSPFGVLSKLLIFSRKTIFKAFVEFNNKPAAVKAAKHLNNKKLGLFGKLCVYASNIKKVKIDNKHLEHKIFEEKINVSTDDSLSNKSEINFLQKTGKKKLCRSFKSDKKGSFVSQEKVTLERKVMFKKGSGLRKVKSVLSDSESNYPTEPTSKVILVSNTEDIFSNKFELFNLFSSFGKIKQLIFMKNLNKALIEYYTLEEAGVSYKCMNCVDMGNTTLKVNYSKYKTIDINRSNRNVNSINYNEIFIVPSEFQREDKDYKPVIQELSSSLLVELNNAENIDVLDVYLEIEQMTKPVKMKFKKEKNNQGKICVRFYLKYDSVASAVKVLLKTHRKELEGEQISVRFN